MGKLCIETEVIYSSVMTYTVFRYLRKQPENKVEFLEREFQSEKLPFVHKKESEHSFELCLSTCVF